MNTRVQRGFERVRFVDLAATSQPSGGVIEVPLPDVSALRGHAPAVIIRIRNDEARSIEIALEVGGRRIGQRLVAAGTTERLDFALAGYAPIAAARRLVLRASGERWALVDLEIANVHGHNRGLAAFVIVPASSAHPTPLRGPTLLASFVLILVGFAARFRPGRARYLHAAAGALAFALLALVYLSPLLSPYKVLLSAKLFGLSVGLLQLPLLVAIVEILGKAAVARTPAAPHGRARLRILRPGRLALVAVATLLILGYVSSFHEPGSGLTRMINFGEAFEDRLLPRVRAAEPYIVPGAGYDAQFYAQLAVDPLLRDPAIARALDSPPYRARRILFSWTAYIMGLGVPRWILQAFAVQNLIAWMVLAWLLTRWFPLDNPRSALLWTACMFHHGLLTSLSFSLLEGPSLLAQAASMAVAEAGRPWTATGIVAIAALGRETNLLWGAHLLVRRPGEAFVAVLRRWMLRGFAIVTPLLVWTLYVTHVAQLGGVATGQRNFSVPGLGLLTEWKTALVNFRGPEWGVFETRVELLVVLAVTVQVVVILARPRWESRWWRAAAVYAILSLFLGPAVWEGIPGAAYRVLLPLSLAYNVLLRDERHFWPLFVLGNTTALAGFAELLHRWP